MRRMALKFCHSEVYTTASSHSVCYSEGGDVGHACLPASCTQLVNIDYDSSPCECTLYMISRLDSARVCKLPRQCGLKTARSYLCERGFARSCSRLHWCALRGRPLAPVCRGTKLPVTSCTCRAVLSDQQFRPSSLSYHHHPLSLA